MMGDGKFEFKIEQGVPLPSRNYTGKKGKSKYPFAQMRSGDSFFVPVKTTARATATNLSANGRKWAISNNLSNVHFVIRRVEDGVRIWRIDDKPNLKDAAE